MLANIEKQLRRRFPIGSQILEYTIVQDFLKQVYIILYIFVWIDMPFFFLIDNVHVCIATILDVCWLGFNCPLACN